jgi:hypothetical protein
LVVRGHFWSFSAIFDQFWAISRKLFFNLVVLKPVRAKKRPNGVQNDQAKIILLKVAKTSRKWLKMTKKVLPKAENGPE